MANPSDLYTICIKHGKIASVSREVKESKISVVDIGGKSVFTSIGETGIGFCELIEGGKKLYINRVIGERRHKSEIYDIIKGEVVLSFECPYYFSPSPNGAYYYAWPFSGFSERPLVYDSTGKLIGEIEHRVQIWNMTALDDSTLLFAEGNICKVIGIPSLETIEEYVFEALLRPSPEIGLAISSDGSVFAAYTPDSIVVYDRLEQREYILTGSYPDIGHGDKIIITDRGRHILSVTLTPDKSKPAYNLYERTGEGYEKKISFDALPFRNEVSQNDFRISKIGNSILVYYSSEFNEKGKAIKQYPSCYFYFDGNSQANPVIIGSENLLVPIPDQVGKYINIKFTDKTETGAILEYKHAKAIQIE
jgi:hypothetical protein